MILDQLHASHYQLIIIGTVHRYFDTFQVIAEKYNSAVIVHNINFMNATRFGLIKSIFKADMMYRLKLWWKEGLLYSSKVYQKAKNLLVLDEELSSDRLKFLPVFYTKNFSFPENKVLTIVIPGGVSQKRRDYKKVFSMIKDLEDGYSDIESKLVDFVFLGKAKNEELKEIIDLERSLNYINITYFTERVSQEDYENWMKKADVLWCPIQQETEFFSQKEIYGHTKMTGNLGDAIKYGKFAVFPKNYPSGLDFIVSEKEELMKQFNDLKNASYDFSKYYNKVSVQKNLENFLDTLI
ncbi:hypothetical protein ACFP3I_03080 [Chryseobacterium arachidis]